MVQPSLITEKAGMIPKRFLREQFFSVPLWLVFLAQWATLPGSQRLEQCPVGSYCTGFDDKIPPEKLKLHLAISNKIRFFTV